MRSAKIPLTDHNSWDKLSLGKTPRQIFFKLRPMLRYQADLRSLFFMAVSTVCLFFNWAQDSVFWPTLLLAWFMPMPTYVMTHNHNHVPMWKSDFLNRLQGYWLTLFYGFPTFAWIPTHNQNHHVYGNRTPGDDTATYKHTEKNNLFSLLSYPLVSSSSQMGRNVRFVRDELKQNPKEGMYYLSQLLLLIAFVAGALILDWQKALLYIVVPHQIGLNSVLLINYVQHVHADEESRWNHSRNFVGGVSNWIMMNNGYHTIHHERPKLHWSEAKREHDRISHLIDPRLNVNIVWYFFSVYFLGIFFKRFRTDSMRLERIEREKQSKLEDDSYGDRPFPAGAELADASPGASAPA